MKQLKTTKINIFVELFDAMFIMILCFATLLSAMLMKGAVISGMNYHINYRTFGVMVFSLTIYIALLVIHSEKGLKGMIKILYADHKQQ